MTDAIAQIRSATSTDEIECDLRRDDQGGEAGPTGTDRFVGQLTTIKSGPSICLCMRLLDPLDLSQVPGGGVARRLFRLR